MCEACLSVLPDGRSETGSITPPYPHPVKAPRPSAYPPSFPSHHQPPFTDTECSRGKSRSVECRALLEYSKMNLSHKAVAQRQHPKLYNAGIPRLTGNARRQQRKRIKDNKQDNNVGQKTYGNVSHPCLEPMAIMRMSEPFIRQI